MKLNSMICALIGLSVVLAAFFAFFSGDSLAQKNIERTEKEKNALEMIQGYEIATNFYNKLISQEINWRLMDFFPPHPIDTNSKNIVMDFQQGNKKARVFISEYDSVEEAVKFSVLDINVNARIENYTQYGEKGRKIYGDTEFYSLAYRKGKFVVVIDCKDEKIADRFAGYVSDSIAQ